VDLSGFHADLTILAKLSCALASGARRAPSGMAPGTVALQLLPGYKNGGPERPRREGVAESRSRTRSWGTIAAFARRIEAIATLRRLRITGKEIARCLSMSDQTVSGS